MYVQDLNGVQWQCFVLMCAARNTMRCIFTSGRIETNRPTSQLRKVCHRQWHGNRGTTAVSVAVLTVSKLFVSSWWFGQKALTSGSLWLVLILNVFLKTLRYGFTARSSVIRIISRLTPRLLSFALCLEWINGIYNTPDTRCLECYRPRASVNTTTTKIDSKHVHYRNTDTIYTVKIVNKRPRNLLNEIQNVFINGKQVKTAKITQIIPRFLQFYATKTTGNSQRRYSPHARTVTFALWQRLECIILAMLV